MNKIISCIFVAVFAICSLPLQANAACETDFVNDESVIQTVYGIYNSTDDGVETQATKTDLISYNSLELIESTSGLLIKAKTQGVEDVDKCGFTYIKLQRMINGTWTDYSTYCYSDLYSETYSYTFLKTLTPPKGYTYRVVCEHYAEEKKLLVFKNTQTIYNVSASIVYD